jgi:hypothetical protein
MTLFKRKIKWKNILSFFLVGVLLVGAVAGLASVFDKDTKTISSMAFGVGGINEQGNYVDSKTSIYTKDMFACQGLTIEPDFEATGTYKVFYYGEDKNFIGATDVMNSEDGVYNKASTFLIAKYARIVITPDVPTNDEGDEEEDFKIRFYEVTGYASDYNITVNKKQDYNFEKILKDYNNVASVLGQGTYDTVNGSGFFSTTSPFYFFDDVDVSNANVLILKVKTSTLSANDEYAGVTITYPSIYNTVSHELINLSYSVAYTVDEFSYLTYDVSSLTSVCGCVDIASIDILEIYAI